MEGAAEKGVPASDECGTSPSPKCGLAFSSALMGPTQKGPSRRAKAAERFDREGHDCMKAGSCVGGVAEELVTIRHSSSCPILYGGLGDVLLSPGMPHSDIDKAPIAVCPETYIEPSPRTVGSAPAFDGYLGG